MPPSVIVGDMAGILNFESARRATQVWNGIRDEMIDARATGAAAEPRLYRARLAAVAVAALQAAAEDMRGKID